MFERDIIGCDEAGRWCWAWPIFWAAVFIPEDKEIPDKIKDSKKLKEKDREEMFDFIKNNYYYAISSISAEDIDSKWLQWANKQVMIESTDKLIGILKENKINVNKTLIDWTLKFETFPTVWNSIIDWDALIPQISAASILAKVSRDFYLKELSLIYPEYGFEKHKGYGTSLHTEKLNNHWVTKEHRLSYKPIKKILESRKEFK